MGASDKTITLLASTMSLSEPSAHRCWLLQLSKSLKSKEINELLYLSEDFIAQTEADLIRSGTGVDFMRSLERHGRLDPNNYSYLGLCLKEIRRMDLLKLPPFSQNTKSAAKEEHLQIAQQFYCKLKAVRDKGQRYLQIKDELQQLSHNTLFWEAWMSDTSEVVSHYRCR